jgi:hypothetical protein
MGIERVQLRYVGQPGKTWEWEDEELSLLEAVARERLAKTQQTGKGLASAVVNCKV